MRRNLSQEGDAPYFECPTLLDNTAKTLLAGAAQDWVIAESAPYQLHAASALSYYCIGGTATAAGACPLPAGQTITRFLYAGETLSVISAIGTVFDVTKEPVDSATLTI